MLTTPEEEKRSKVKISGEITDMAREVTDDEKKLSNLFFSLLDKPGQYLNLIRKIIANGKNNP